MQPSRSRASGWQALKDSASEVVAKLGERRREVAAIGVSGQQHGLVALDGGGHPVRPAKLWCDNSTVTQCEELTAALGGLAETVAAVGNSMRTGYTAPKILWLKQNEPENWKRTASILLPHDYLNFLPDWKAGHGVRRCLWYSPARYHIPSMVEVCRGGDRIRTMGKVAFTDLLSAACWGVDRGTA